MMVSLRSIPGIGPPVNRTERMQHRIEASVDTSWVLNYTVKDGLIAEVQNFCYDQHAADLFYWKVWKLESLPDRIERKA